MAQQSVVAELRDAYYSELDAGEQSALIAWLAFTGAWSGVRGITHAIKAGKGPFRNMSLGGEHLHHYMWGIGMLAGVGGVAVRGDEKLHRHPATAVTYGVGLALIVDEFALLLDLQDVYWAKQGRISVDVAIGGIAAAGSVFAALPVLRKVAHRLRERGKETESLTVLVLGIWPLTAAKSPALTEISSRGSARAPNAPRHGRGLGGSARDGGGPSTGVTVRAGRAIGTRVAPVIDGAGVGRSMSPGGSSASGGSPAGAGSAVIGGAAELGCSPALDGPAAGGSAGSAGGGGGAGGFART